MKNEQADKDIQLKNLELEQERLKNSNELLNKAIEEGVPLWKEYLNKKIEKLDAPKIKISLIGFITIFILVVGGTGYLVYIGKLDGSNFTFLLGIMIGALITLLRDIIVPTGE